MTAQRLFKKQRSDDVDQPPKRIHTSTNTSLTKVSNVYAELIRQPPKASTAPCADLDQCIANVFLKHKTAHNGDERRALAETTDDFMMSEHRVRSALTRCAERQAGIDHNEEKRGRKPWFETVGPAVLDRIRVLIHTKFYAAGVPPTRAAINAAIAAEPDLADYKFTSISTLTKCLDKMQVGA